MTSFHLNHFHEDPVSKHSHFLMSWGLGLQHIIGRNITEPITTLKPKKKNIYNRHWSSAVFQSDSLAQHAAQWTPPTIHHPALVFCLCCLAGLPCLDQWRPGSCKADSQGGYLQSKARHQLPAPPPLAIALWAWFVSESLWLSRKIRSVKDSRTGRLLAPSSSAMIRAQWTETENLPRALSGETSRLQFSHLFFNNKMK